MVNNISPSLFMGWDMGVRLWEITAFASARFAEKMCSGRKHST